jgi:hypothetical protein
MSLVRDYLATIMVDQEIGMTVVGLRQHLLTSIDIFQVKIRGLLP